MNLLEIKNPAFLKKLNIKQLNKLSEDIRSFIIQSVSKTGGYLSSNLGVVELTIALHYCFNAPKDKLLFDIGHQSYTHKILTGRAKQLSSLGQFKGISNFIKTDESIYDCFEAGHNSTSLAAALGMATARDLNNDSYEIVSLIGDGSLSSGLALETLRQIGLKRRKMLIVFNDNEDSITKNNELINENINKIRNSKGYNYLKDNVKNVLKNVKHGDEVIEDIHVIKEKIKKTVIDQDIFSNFGIYYIGPVDGHNIKDLIRAFEVAKSKNIPVVVHCLTKKGKGYKFAENDYEDKWHYVDKFNIEEGQLLSDISKNEISYSQLVGECVGYNMSKNDDIVAIDTDSVFNSGLKQLIKNYSLRYFDVGFVQDMAIEYACGLALNGKKPFVSVASSFLQRAYDQINNEVAKKKIPMLIGINHCSLVGEDIETQHGVFDISLIRSLPNVVLAQGKDAQEIADLIYTAFNNNVPFVLRNPDGCLLKDYNCSNNTMIPLGKWEYLLEKENPDVYILSYGNDIMNIKKIIAENNLNYSLINCRYLKPIDEKMIKEICDKNKPVFLYTCDLKKGGLADDILEFCNDFNISINLQVIGVEDNFVTYGSLKQLKDNLGIDIKSLFEKIELILK